MGSSPCWCGPRAREGSSATTTRRPRPGAPAAAAAAATCKQYDVTGTWTITNTGGYRPTATLQQSGTTLTGTFTLSDAEAQTGGLTQPTNPLTGTLEGDQLVFVADLPHRDGFQSKGEYKGSVTETGLANGTAKDLALANGPTIGWGMEGKPVCVSKG